MQLMLLVSFAAEKSNSHLQNEARMILDARSRIIIIVHLLAQYDKHFTVMLWSSGLDTFCDYKDLLSVHAHDSLFSVQYGLHKYLPILGHWLHDSSIVVVVVVVHAIKLWNHTTDSELNWSELLCRILTAQKPHTTCTALMHTCCVNLCLTCRINLLPSSAKFKEVLIMGNSLLYKLTATSFMKHVVEKCGLG